MNTPSADQLADHLLSVFHDDAWTAVGVRETFRRSSAQQAAAHPVAGAHSAWEILLHINAWHRAVVRRLNAVAVTLAG